jgi:hypothetical protein
MRWEQMSKLGREFPEVVEDIWYGTPALKVRGKGFARLRTTAATNRSHRRGGAPRPAAGDGDEAFAPTFAPQRRADRSVDRPPRVETPRRAAVS